MDDMIVPIGHQRKEVKIYINGYVSTVRTKMYCTFENKPFNKIEVKFRVKNVYGKQSDKGVTHTIVFELQTGIGFIPSEYNDIHPSTRNFVYLCTICGYDKKRIIYFMCEKHSMYIVNLDTFLRFVHQYNIRTDNRFKQSINVHYWYALMND
jgi:hypothetical protein